MSSSKLLLYSIIGLKSKIASVHEDKSFVDSDWNSLNQSTQKTRAESVVDDNAKGDRTFECYWEHSNRNAKQKDER